MNLRQAGSYETETSTAAEVAPDSHFSSPQFRMATVTVDSIVGNMGESLDMGYRDTSSSEELDSAETREESEKTAEASDTLSVGAGGSGDDHLQRSDSEVGDSDVLIVNTSTLTLSPQRASPELALVHSE